ncbi:spermidine synthase [Brevibacterium album]|uniref:spermidine synthase n=1 Tax=Brevibacterium album TaxID=417948 RepID=UPI00040DD0ED|nr:fused MFS/spermidine synthase [Brevibacterium album]
MSSRRRRSGSAPSTGPFPIDTGTASFDPVPGDPAAFVLTVNGVPSSPYAPADPGRLDFEYMRWLIAGIDSGLPVTSRPTLRALHVGGAACALPRRIAADRPGSRQTVAEVDAALATWVRAHLDLPRSPAVAIRAAEGGAELARQREDSLDLVVRDAFSGDVTPPQLQSPEWFASAARALGAHGLYCANVADTAGRAALRAEAEGLRGCFPHLAAITGGGRLAGRAHGNVVVLAAHAPLDPADIARRARAEGCAVPTVHGRRTLLRACGLSG